MSLSEHPAFDSPRTTQEFNIHQWLRDRDPRASMSGLSQAAHRVNSILLFPTGKKPSDKAA